MPGDGLTAESMERTMREYFQACNDGDVERIAGFFVEDGIHYCPPGMYGGPFVGGRTIGERWAAAVEELGSVWTVDSVMTDPDTARAAMEWTHFKTEDGTVLRGDEWYEFDPETGLIEEIRAYYASPQDDSLDRLELGGFDYEARGYPVDPPFERD
jgi:hypothetical protein